MHATSLKNTIGSLLLLFSTQAFSLAADDSPIEALREINGSRKPMIDPDNYDVNNPHLEILSVRQGKMITVYPLSMSAEEGLQLVPEDPVSEGIYHSFISNGDSPWLAAMKTMAEFIKSIETTQ